MPKSANQPKGPTREAQRMAALLRAHWNKGGEGGALTQVQLAKKLGCSQPYINGFLSPDGPSGSIGAEYIRAAREAWGVSPMYFYEDNLAGRTWRDFIEKPSTPPNGTEDTLRDVVTRLSDLEALVGGRVHPIRRAR